MQKVWLFKGETSLFDKYFFRSEVEYVIDFFRGERKLISMLVLVSCFDKKGRFLKSWSSRDKASFMKSFDVFAADNVTAKKSEKTMAVERERIYHDLVECFEAQLPEETLEKR